MSLLLVNKSPIKIDTSGRTSYLLKDFRKIFFNQKRGLNRVCLGSLWILAFILALFRVVERGAEGDGSIS